jgi:hypothetical protein
MIAREVVYVPSDQPRTQETRHIPGVAYHTEITQRQRDHWAKLHTTLMDAVSFEAWVAAIPGCETCRRDFRELMKSNPPRFDDWFRWTWEVHNEVNRKIGKPVLTWSEACHLWKNVSDPAEQ